MIRAAQSSPPMLHPKPSAARRLGRGTFWAALGLAVVLAAAYAGWRALAAVDFGYPAAYALLDIDATIATYGPENELRPGFHTTSADERARIFGAIAAAVRAEGRGLESIRYRLPGGRRLPVLTGPEIQHLRDVASLVTAFERVGLTALALGAVLFAGAWYRRWSAPPIRRFLLGLVGLVLTGTLGVLVVGPVRTFYWLHERVFPPDHEWFFWYEESLMSMLMQAPNLFGAIAIAWLALTVVLAGGLWHIATRALAQRAHG